MQASSIAAPVRTMGEAIRASLAGVVTSFLSVLPGSSASPSSSRSGGWSPHSWPAA